MLKDQFSAIGSIVRVAVRKGCYVSRVRKCSFFSISTNSRVVLEANVCAAKQRVAVHSCEVLLAAEAVIGRFLDATCAETHIVQINELGLSLPLPTAYYSLATDDKINVIEDGTGG